MSKSDKIISQNNKTIGTVTKVYKCWWIKINQEPVRSHALDGASFPHIITVNYTADSEQYSKKKFLHYNITCPNVNDKIDVYYDAAKPSKFALKI